MPLTLLQYADYLDTRRDLSWPAAPDPDPPRAKPHLVALPEIRAVSWSVYGTLLTVPGGELCFEHPQKFVMDVALDKTLQEFKMWGSMSRKPGQPADYLGQIYGKVLAQFRTAPSPGEKNPEVAAELVWEEIVKKLLQKDYKWDVNFFGSLNEYSRKIAYFFHASLQGTACYPGAAQALRHLAGAGIPQGVVDNGQLFTPVQLERGLRAQDGAARLDQLVDPKLWFLSHQYRSRKPSDLLFRELLAVLQDRGIGPGAVLHVGSSVLRDVVPAKRLGLRTALFAGDRNALQATPEQLKEAASRPDVLLTELSQISHVVAA